MQDFSCIFLLFMVVWISTFCIGVFAVHFFGSKENGGGNNTGKIVITYVDCAVVPGSWSRVWKHMEAKNQMEVVK